MKYVPKMFKKSKSGVSEIIGNLLVLAITVTLFSSVMFYVMNIPGAQDQTFADFQGEVICWTVPSVQGQVNITKNGGELLEELNHKIVLIINDKVYQHTLADGGVGTTWAIGETWSYTNSSLKETDKVEVMILDLVNNDVVWTANLAGGSVNQAYAPIIVSRGIIQYPPYAGDLVNFYCKVIDYNNNLDTSSVYVNISGLAGITTYTMAMTYDSSTGLFKSGSIELQEIWNSQVVTFYAEDLTNLEGSSSYQMVVFHDSTEDNGGGGGSGLFPASLLISNLQAYNIFEGEDWDENNFSATPTRDFDHGQDVVVIVASKILVNVLNQNDLLVYDSTTKLLSSVSRADAFRFHEYRDGYYVYKARFSTTSLNDDWTYSLQMQMKDSWTPNNVFFAKDSINIGNAGLVKLTTYSDAALTNPTVNFTTEDTIYVKVTTPTTGTWVQNGGDVIISDFFGAQPIKMMPSSDTTNPVKLVTQLDTYNWTFKIELIRATQDPWTPGKCAYSLSYDMFVVKDASNNYYRFLINRAINITAPGMFLDLAGALGGSSMGTQHIERFVMSYYANDNQWNPPQIITAKGGYSKGVTGYLCECGDMNYDLKTDIVGVIYDGSDYQLVMYMNDGSWTQKNIATLTSAPSAMALGNTDLDNDLDILLGYSDGTVTIYRNDGIWTQSNLASPGGSDLAVYSLAVGDLNFGRSGNILNASNDIVVGRGKSISFYRNVDGIGQNFMLTQFTGSIPTTQHEYATGETNTVGTATGTWQDTIPGNLQETLTEANANVATTSYARIVDNGFAPTSIGSYTDVKYDDTAYVTVNNGVTASVYGFATSLTDLDISNKISVTLKVTYWTGSSYVAKNLVVKNYAGTTISTTSLPQSTSQTTMNIDLTSYVTSASYLNGINLNFTNAQSNNNNRQIYFDAFEIIVVYNAQCAALEHTYTITAAAGSSSLQVDSYKDAADSDNFTFQYSLDSGTTWTTAFTVSATSPTPYSSGAFATTTGMVVQVKVIDADRTDTTLNSVVIDNLQLATTPTSSDTIGYAVNAVKIEDMNSDGYNEVVSVDASGRLRTVRYVADSTIPSTALVSWMSSISAPANCINIAVGWYAGASGGYLDVIAATTSGVYVMNHSPTFGEFAAQVALPMPSFAIGDISSMVGANIDGTGGYDYVIGSVDGYIVYMRCIDATTNTWQTILIDHIYTDKGAGYDVRWLALGKLQNQ